MGESKTPKPFVKSCDQFKYLDLLLQDDEKEVGNIIKNSNSEKSNLNEDEDDVTDISTIKDFIVKVIHGDTEAGKRTDLGTLGKKLNEKFSEFDVRYYGYNKLSTFIENISGLILEKEGNLYYVKEKERKIDRDEIEKFIIDVVENNKKKIKNIGFILEAIKAKYPNFSFKAEGYNQFSKFLNSFDKISVNGNSIKVNSKLP